MNHAEKLNYIATKAGNMIEIEGLICQVTAEALNAYAEKFTKAPRDIKGQNDWVKRAVAFYAKEIALAKSELIAAIPARFHNTIMYKRLTVAI